MGNFFYHFCKHLTTFVPRLGSRHYRSGYELVPKTGPALLLANHISHFDPPLMAVKFPRIIHYMADKPLVDIPIAGTMLKLGHTFPIDRTKNDRAALRTAMARLEAGNVVGIFPEKGIRFGPTSVLGGAELPMGTAALWRMMDVPVIPMVVIGTDQLYAWQALFRRPRIFLRVGPTLLPDRSASKEELRDRVARAWHGLFEAMKKDYDIQPEELPHSAQERWAKK